MKDVNFARVQVEFREILIENSQCVVDSDCVIFEPGCPFGCEFYFINKANLFELENIQSKFRNDFCSTIGNDCTVSRTLINGECIEAKCVVSDNYE